MVAVQSMGQQDVAPAGEPAWTETTRLMCAAAYLEGTFAQDVCEDVVEERFRAVHVPLAVDIGAVARHCIAARRQKVLRDVVLLGILVVSGVSAGVSSDLIAIGFLAAWAVVAWDLWASTYHVAVRKLNATDFRPEDAPEPQDEALRERLEELEARQRGNVTVYSGFSPFSGSGFDLGGWSFTVDLRKGREHLGQRTVPKPFRPHELYDAVAAAVRGLEIPGLVIEDRLFVSGQDIRDDRTLLPSITGRPASTVDVDLLARHVDAPTHRVRNYKCVRVVDWRGQLVLSHFLRFSVDAGRLFTEVSTFLLTPLREELRRIDGLDPQVTLRQVARIAGLSLARTVPLWLRSPSAIARPVLRVRRRAKRLRRVKRDRFFDYGSPTTALDRARAPQYTRYFQMLDKEMYTKVLERTALDAVVEFLEAHDIDTGELVERRSTIINNGIMVPGGSVQAHNLAVGQGASILTRVRTAAAASRGGAAREPAKAPGAPAPRL